MDFLKGKKCFLLKFYIIFKAVTCLWYTFGTYFSILIFVYAESLKLLDAKIREREEFAPQRQFQNRWVVRMRTMSPPCTMCSFLKYTHPLIDSIRYLCFLVNAAWEASFLCFLLCNIVENFRSNYEQVQNMWFQ